MTTTTTKSTHKFNPQAEKFISLFNLKVPIVEAPAAGPAGAKLAIAVAEAGGMGSLPLTWASPDYATKVINHVKAATNGAFLSTMCSTFRQHL